MEQPHGGDVLQDAQDELDRIHPPREVSRRGFVKTSLAAGFAAAVMPVQAQTMITTDTQGLTAGEVKIKTADGEMPAYRAAPAGKTSLATVLVVQEIFGVHEHIKDVCRRFAKAGYLAIAPELYARQGDPTKYSDIPTLVKEVVSKVPDAQVMSDLDATAAWAAANGGSADKLGITGFCWGGRITWLYNAYNPKCRAGVAWYGRVVGDSTPNTPKHPIDLAGSIRQPVLALYGGADAGIPNETIERMMAALKSAGNTISQLVLYKDAPHAFHADYRPSYRKEAADDGWKRAVAWFNSHLA
ncbi:MAG: dienelactone hydrolase family protein [Burkholderiaceae bacterium]|jgi:carboxymethylenebutenolidase|nr:dienelactone hydrolase family protein [Burkholderiaceae bacterium]